MSSFESKIPKPVNDVTQSPFANKKPEPLLPDIMEEENKLSAAKDNDAEQQQFSNEPGAEQEPEQHALAEENAETDPVEKRKLQLEEWAKESEATDSTVQRMLQLQAWAKESEATDPTVQRMLQLQAWAKASEATDPTVQRMLQLQAWAKAQEATDPTVLRKLELQKRFSLSVSQPGDPRELEADKKSEEVMGAPLTPEGGLQRLEDDKDTVEDKEELSAKSAGSGGKLSVDAATKDYISNLSGGEPMRKQDQQFFGDRFGADFSDVRIHTDSTAAESAQAINAKAYTKENNIVFGKGQYQPDTSSGKKLMAHELTHVLQQRGIVNREVMRRDGSAKQPGFFTRMAMKAALKIVNKIPPGIFGPFSILVFIFKHGAIGFLNRLAAAGGEQAAKIIKNAARAFTTFAFLQNYALGLLKGFFQEGLWGTVQLLWHIVKLPYTLFQFGARVVKYLGDADILGGLQSIGHAMINCGSWILRSGPAIINHFRSAGSSLSAGSAARFLTGMLQSARGAVQRGGSFLADRFISFFSQSTDTAAPAMGMALGKTVGQVLFEIVLTIITAGAGGAVAAIRRSFGWVFSLLSKGGKGLLTIAKNAMSGVRYVASLAWSKLGSLLYKISAPLGAKFRQLISAIREFCNRLLTRIKAGRKKPKIDPKEKPAYKPDPVKKARELPEALAQAKVIAETHDTLDSPLPVVIANLNVLKRAYRWIKRFIYKLTSPGHYKIIMEASEHEVDADYTPKQSSKNMAAKNEIVAENYYKQYRYKGGSEFWYKGVPDTQLSRYMNDGFQATGEASHILSASSRMPNTGWHYGAVLKETAWQKQFTNLENGLVFKLKNTQKNIDVDKYFKLASGGAAEKGEVARWLKIGKNEIAGVEFYIGSGKHYLSMEKYSKFTVQEMKSIDMFLKETKSKRIQLVLNMNEFQKRNSSVNLGWLKKLLKFSEIVK